MERVIITISEGGSVNIPSGNVWMSEMELVELFGVTAPALRAAIKAVYKSGTLCLATTQRCDLAMPKSWATFYNIEVVIALAFSLNTYEASRIRQKVLESLYRIKEGKGNLFVCCVKWESKVGLTS
jgi:DNA-binding FadR family transcriptional regulator